MDGVCQAGICQEKIEEKACTSNLDCNNGSEVGDYYCDITGGEGPASDRLSTECFKNLFGVCRPKGTLPAVIEVNGIPTYKIPTRANQWSSINLCLAHNKKLFTIEEVGCYVSGTTQKFTSGGTGQDECCARGKKCVLGDWGQRESNGMRGPTIVDMTRKYGGTFGLSWTSSVLNVKSDNACDGFVFYLNSGRLGSGGHRGNYAYNVLCHDKTYEVKECDAGFYKSGHGCAYCGNGVEKCIDSTQAEVCYDGYTLTDGKCVK